MAKRPLEAEAWKPPTGLSWGIEVDAQRLVFVSGHVGWDEHGNLVGEDIASQTRQTFENIARTLSIAGGTLDDIVSMTVYLADMNDYASFGEVRKQTFNEPFPASTTIGASDFIMPGILVEIDAIAVL